MYETNTNPLQLRQLEREDQQVSLGIDRYYKHIGKMATSDTKPGHALAYKAIAVTAEGIYEVAEAVAEGKAGKGRPAAFISYIRVLEPVAAAYIAARCIINGMGQAARVQTVALQIATQIEEHFQFDELQNEAPGLANHMSRKADKWTTGRARRFIMRLGVKIAGVRGLEWKTGDKLSLGMKLIEIFVERTGFCELTLINPGQKTAATILRATTQTEEWLESEHKEQALSHPRFLPMLVKPRDWDKRMIGGYLTDVNRVELISGMTANLRDDVMSSDIDEVYAALNRVQSTAWRVNTAVLDVLTKVWQAGETLGGIPDAEDLPPPPRPADIPADMAIESMTEEQKARLNEYRAEKRKVHEQNAGVISKRLSLATQISMASENKGEAAFYFPHNLDFRGRMYSVVAGLNPQGDDTGKALIEFAEGKPLGERGAMWLMVHIANLFGEDKCSFEDRVTWTDVHHDLIMDSADDPLDGQRFWAEADYPYCALAACIEYAEAYESGDPDQYVSHLPIAMDGSCSGLQHFSAMLKDKEGGSAVNLTPLPTPADIYTEVAERAEVLIAESGDPDLNCWAGKVTRKIVKRPCMTFAYSVTSRGMRDQILDEMRKESKGGDYLPGVVNFEAATKLAPIVERAICDTVTRASEAMGWLKQCVSVYYDNVLENVNKELNEDAFPVNWRTPDGLPIQQRYAKMNGKRFDIWFQGTRMKIQLRVPTQNPDQRKQLSGVSPNFVHSMDAYHLRKVVNRMVNEGVTTSFAMIHDSFGTHACDVDELHHVIRDEFIKLYSQDILAEFINDLTIACPKAEWPALPAAGDLNLEEVRDADFFFS